MTSSGDALTPIIEYPDPISPDSIRSGPPHLAESDTNDDETSGEGLEKSDNSELLSEGDFRPIVIADFYPNMVGCPDKPSAYEDDLRMSYFIKSNTFWAGEQRRGIQFSIPSAASKSDFVYRAMAEPFRLAGEIPLPAEVRDSLSFFKNTPNGRNPFVLEGPSTSLTDPSGRRRSDTGRLGRSYN